MGTLTRVFCDRLAFVFAVSLRERDSMEVAIYHEVIIETRPSHLLVRCGRCRGTGTRDRDGRDPKCAACAGAGSVLVRVQPGSFVRCGFCRGDGTRDRDGRDPVCPVCKGVGGVFVELPAVTCSKCKGTGSRDRDGKTPLCSTCGGKGVVPISRLKEY